MQRRFLIQITEKDLGQRLDKVLSHHVPEVSRELLQKAIKAGNVSGEGGGYTKPAQKIENITELTVDLAMPAPQNLTPIPLEDFFDQPLKILFEDEHLLILNKPAGLTVHPGAGTANEPTLVHALLHHCRLSAAPEAPLRPGIVHRLDKDTSGVMVVAKTDTIHGPLAQLFEERDITRSYVALCYGSPLPVIGDIEAPLGRHPTARTKMAIVQEKDGGKPAITQYRVQENFADQASLIQCKLLTGRTHQIRVHLMHRGHPIIGDVTYARTRNLKHATPELSMLLANTKRQMLHAQELGFTHPITGENIHCTAPPPQDFQSLHTQLQKTYA